MPFSVSPRRLRLVRMMNGRLVVPDLFSVAISTMMRRALWIMVLFAGTGDYRLEGGWAYFAQYKPFGHMTFVFGLPCDSQPHRVKENSQMIVELCSPLRQRDLFRRVKLARRLSVLGP